MKIFIICSKSFYSQIPAIQDYLEAHGHEIVLPNSYDNPNAEKESWVRGEESHVQFKRAMFKRSADVTKGVDAVFVLNFTKNGVEGYIGGATFIEIYDAFRLEKQIFLYNPISESIFSDELHGFAPTVINGHLSYFA